MSVAVYLVETGLLLAVSPWTVMWQHNYFAAAVPALADLMNMTSIRGGVVTAGIVTALAGMKDLKAALAGGAAPADAGAASRASTTPEP